MSVVYSFRDSLAIDETILDRWSAQNPNLMPSAYGDTLVPGGVHCQLESLSSDFDYVIMADSLTTAPMIQMWHATGPVGEAYAQAIITPVHLDLPGTLGADTRPGGPGRDGELGSCSSDRR